MYELEIPKEKVPKEIIERTERISYEDIKYRIEDTLLMYQQNIDGLKWADFAKLKDIIIVGSFVSKDFEPDKSDLDYILVVGSTPVKFHNYEKYANRIDKLKLFIEEAEAMDCVDIGTPDEIEKKLKKELKAKNLEESKFYSFKKDSFFKITP